MAPTTAADYIGLFNSSMQSKDPVLIIEHHEFYQTVSAAASDSLDYFVEIGKAQKNPLLIIYDEDEEAATACAVGKNGVQ